MRYGMCIGGKAANISIAANAGFDYIESCFSLLTDSSEDEFAAFSNELKKYNIKCETVNCFLPGRLKVTGPDVDEEALKQYIERGINRGKSIGLRKVVFGSSGARNVPERWTYEKAYFQIAEFLKNIVAPIAEKYDVIITIEPLRSTDSNIINSAAEGAILASFADSENIKSLVDYYHMETAGDNCETVRKLKGSIKHAHIAEPVNRKYPCPGDGVDYKSFIEALEFAGCDTCSVEASTDDFEKDCAPSLKAIKY